MSQLLSRARLCLESLLLTSSHNLKYTADDPSSAMSHESLITADDLTSYRAKWKPAMKVKLDSKTTLYTAPLPSGGATLAYIMNIMAAVKVSSPLQVRPLSAAILLLVYSASPKKKKKEEIHMVSKGRHIREKSYRCFPAVSEFSYA